MNTNTLPLNFLVRQKTIQKLCLRANWSSYSVGHRQRIHRWIAYQGFDPDYQREPRASIAHCPALGGVVIHHQGPIGLDIEIADRIKPHVIERIKNPGDELNGLPLALVWTAKEALFKLRRGNQKLLANIGITQPYRLRRHLWQVHSETAVIYSCLWQGLAISVALPWNQNSV